MYLSEVDRPKFSVSKRDTAIVCMLKYEIMKNEF